MPTPSPYPMFDFGSEKLAELNEQIRAPDGCYNSNHGPYWIRYRTLNPGRLPTFRVLLSPIYGQRHGRQLREEILVGDKWVDSKAMPA